MSQDERIACVTCGEKDGNRLGQTIVAGRLMWSRSGLWSQCVAFEEDGYDFPPDWVRTILLMNGGEWEVMAEGADRVVLLMTIRQLFDLTMVEGVQRSRQFPSVSKGTKTEAEWVKMKLSDVGVASKVAESRELGG